MELFYSMDSVVQDAIMSNIDIETLKSLGVSIGKDDTNVLSRKSKQ